jgi:hypothetical protein
VIPFRYLRDSLFLASCAFYALNRWLIKPWSAISFFHGHFNDILLIPCALPPILWAQSWLGLRKKEDAPTTGEIAFHLIVWSVLFEFVGPHFLRVTGDLLDIAAYTFGAIFSSVWWRCAYRQL